MGLGLRSRNGFPLVYWWMFEVIERGVDMGGWFRGRPEVDGWYWLHDESVPGESGHVVVVFGGCFGYYQTYYEGEVAMRDG